MKEQPKPDWADDAVHRAWPKKRGVYARLPCGGAVHVVRLAQCDFVVWRQDGTHASQALLCSNSVEAAYAMRAIAQRANAAG